MELSVKIRSASAHLDHIHRLFLDLLFPPRCAVCDAPVGKSAEICPDCALLLRRIREPRCCRCGKALPDNEEEYCTDCRDRRHEFIRGTALYEYPCIREALFRFKNKGRAEYAAFFGGEMARYLGREILSWKPDALIPIPLYAAKERRRGYNQAALLADELGKRIGIPVEKRLVRRVRATKPMKKLGLRDRQINLKKAFHIAPDVVKLNTVILVDDIYTTGATIDAVAAELKARGVSNVYFAALSIGSGN